MARPKVRDAFKRDRVQAYKVPGDSMTEQHHARACDVNTIMAKYLKSGVIDHIKQYEPQFGDVSNLDFKTSMDQVAAVKSEFHNLPAFVRDHYKQDPGAYLDAVSTEEGIEELRKLKPPGQKYDRDGNREVPENTPTEPSSDGAKKEPAQPAPDGDAVT